MNIKRTTLLLLTLFIVLTTVSAISAVSDDSSVVTDDSQSVSVDTAINSDISSASSSSNSDVSTSTPTKTVDTQKTTTDSSSSDKSSIDSSSSNTVSTNSSSSNTVSSDTTSSSQSTTSKTSSESATVKTTDSQDTNNANDNNKEINSVKNSTVDSNKTTKTTTTHIVNSTTIGDFFDLTTSSGYLTDLVNEGDTLDFQGTIELKNQSLTINKPVNVISSTNDGNISLDTIAGSYFGENPGSSFIINNEGSYTNVTGLKFYNSQIWIYNASHVIIDNITVHVINQRVGSGNGHTSIREGSEYVTVKNSYFYTENNEGSSSVVLAGANYCTIDNNTIQAVGTVGNLVYLTTNNVNTDTSELNRYNNITNNHIIGPESALGSCWAIVLTGCYNLVENNTVDYETGVGLNIQSGASSITYNNTINNNDFSNTAQEYAYTNFTFTNNQLSKISASGNNCTFINNTFVSTNSTSFSATNYTFINNTFNQNNTISGNYAIVSGNVFKSNMTLSGQYGNYTNNNFNGPTTVSGNYINAYENTFGNLTTISGSYKNVTENTFNGPILLSGSSSNITDNQINGNITVTSTGNLIEGNNINTTTTYAVNVTGANNQVINNNILANTLSGNEAVVATGNNVTIENNTPESTSVVITNTTYSQYFDENGELNASLANYTTVILSGEITDKNFIFTDRILNIIAEDENTQLKGVTFTSKDDAKISLNNLKINNTGYDIESAIIFESDLNVIDGCDIYYYTETTNAMLVVFEGDENKIVNSNVSLYGISDDIDYTKLLQIAPTTAIAVFSSGNLINNNNITTSAVVEKSTDGFGSLYSVTLQQNNTDDVMENNTITNNNIKTEGIDYAYGINLLYNSNNNNITSNTINTTSERYANGIRFQSDPANNNIIVSNKINVTANDLGYGIIFSAYRGDTEYNNNISSNTVIVNANQGYGLDIYTSNSQNIQNTTVRSNTFTITGDYSMGVGLYQVTNITIASNTFNIVGTTNETDETSYDFIKPTTAGIVLMDCGDTVNISSNSKINVTNGIGIKVINTNNVNISSNSIYTKNSVGIYLNSSDNTYMYSNSISTDVTGVLLISSSTNDVTLNKINSTDVEYTIEADSDSTKNNISDNTLLSKDKFGDNAVNVANSDNTVKYNNPYIIYLTDDNFNTYFDENGVFGGYESDNITIILASDLHNKDMLFNTNVTLTNPDGYTIYDSTITLNDSTTGKYTNLFNLNINVTDGRESVIIINNGNSNITNCNIYQYNENTGARTIYVTQNGTISSMMNNNITVYGAEIKTDDGTPSLAIIYEVSENTKSYTTKQTQGNFYIEAVYSDGEGTTMGIYSKDRTSQLKLYDLNLTVIGDNQAIGSYSNLICYYNSTFNISSNNEAIGYMVDGQTSTTETNVTANITVSAPNNAIGILVENSAKFDAYTSKIIVTSNNTATGIILTDVSRSSAQNKVFNTTIEVTAPIATGLNFSSTPIDVSNSTITVKGNTAQAIIDINGIYRTSRINITNNTITVNTVNPTVSIELLNMTSTNVINNTIETNSNSQYVITVTNSSRVNVTYNNISRNGKLVGDTGVGVVNSETVLVENNPYYDPIVVVTVPEEAKIGSTITLTATLYVNNGTVNDGYVIFKVNGKTLKDDKGNVIEVPVIDGVATYEYTVPVTSSSIFTVSAVYNGEYGVARSDNTTFTSIPSTASIELTTTGTLMPGQTVTFTAYITDEFGNAVTTGKVVFKLNGVSLKDENGNVLYAYVDENGYASINYTIPSNFSAKDYTLTAVFQGTGYERTETNDTITITKINTKVTVDSSIIDATTNTITITQGENLQLKATITDEAGNAVTGTTKVAVKINEKTVVQQYVTDGVIDLTIYTSSFKNPTYTIEIIAGENSQYNKSTYDGTLSVLEPNNLLINETSNNGTLNVLEPNSLINETSNNGTLLVVKD